MCQEQSKKCLLSEVYHQVSFSSQLWARVNYAIVISAKTYSPAAFDNAGRMKAPTNSRMSTSVFPLFTRVGKGLAAQGRSTLPRFWAAEVGGRTHTVQLQTSGHPEQHGRVLVTFEHLNVLQVTVRHEVECFKKKWTYSRASPEEPLVQILWLSDLTCINITNSFIVTFPPFLKCTNQIISISRSFV